MRRMWSAVLVGLVCSVVALTDGSAVAVASPRAAGDNARTGTLRTASTTTATQAFEDRLRELTNARRHRHGCRALRLSSTLALAARRHSALMSNQDNLSHRLAGEADLAGRAVSAGYTHWRILAENLAWGQTSPREVFRDWVHSPGHRANLDNCRLRDVGFGVVVNGGRPWVTADFGRKA